MALFLHSMVLSGRKLENLRVRARSLVVGSLPILLPADSAQSASLSWIIRCLIRSRHQARFQILWRMLTWLIDSMNCDMSSDASQVFNTETAFFGVQL